MLEISPNEITFYGPFDVVVSSKLVLKNHSGDRVCFKVKTTAPKQYCVRPNVGFINPHESVDVSVMLQPCSDEERARHKFMVQSVKYGVDEGDETAESIWRNVNSSNIQESRLRCVFKSKDGNAAAAPDASLTQSPGEPSKVLNESQIAQELEKYKDENAKLQANISRMQKLMMLNKPAPQRDDAGSMAVVPPIKDNSDGFGMMTIACIVIVFIIGLVMGKFVL